MQLGGRLQSQERSQHLLDELLWRQTCLAHNALNLPFGQSHHRASSQFCAPVPLVRDIHTFRSGARAYHLDAVDGRVEPLGDVTCRKARLRQPYDQFALSHSG